MSINVIYVFDPLCGWCYGASNTLQALSTQPDITLNLLPSGLFSGRGARPIDRQFASFAWSNDQRIAQLTGQTFSDRYRQSVLNSQGQFLNSEPANLALTATHLTRPERELECLHQIQRSRYVLGDDITDDKNLMGLLTDNGLDEAAELFAHKQEALVDAAKSRYQYAHQLLASFLASGVPTFIADHAHNQALIPRNLAFQDPERFVAEVRASKQI